MVQREQFVDRPDRDDLAVGEHRNPVADRVERIEIVRDQEYRQPQGTLERQRQFVERRRPDRVEPGGRLVEEQEFGIERQRARKSRALPHPARQFGRIFGPRVGGQSGHHDLVRGDLVQQREIKVGIEFAKRHLHVLGDGQRREQRAALKQHAPALANSTSFCFVAVDASCSPNTVISPSPGVCSPMIERISTDLPVPEPPTTPMISPRLTSRSSPSWTI